MSFGSVIPVTGLNLGFPGNVSRLADDVIASRPVLTTANAIPFGSAVVIISNNAGTFGGGDSYESVADFIAGGGTMTAALFAGVAVRNVKTLLSYTSLGNNDDVAQIGQFAPGELAEVLERGSITVVCNVGTPVSQGAVYLRIAANASIPAGVVGGFEAAADGANTIDLSTVGVVWRTGAKDANNVAEITLKTRVTA